MKYRLNKAETVPVKLYQVARTKVINGKSIVTYSNYIKLIPGEEYESDDEAMLDWFRQYKRKVRRSASVEEALNRANVPYDIELCRSCGGRVKKIVYHPVEVYDE